jgi:hypothetical protein
MSLPSVVIDRARQRKVELEDDAFESMPAQQKVGKLLEIYDEMTENRGVFPEHILEMYDKITEKIGGVEQGKEKDIDYVYGKMLIIVEDLSNTPPEEEPPVVAPPPPAPGRGGRRSTIGKKFNKCVKAVRKTVKAREGSNKESAAIAICTTTILYPRKRTIKKYRKGRLVTQRRKAD